MSDIKITKWKGAERLATSELEDLNAELNAFLIELPPVRRARRAEKR